MITPYIPFETLERESKTSSGIVVIISYIGLVSGLIMMYSSTIDFAIKDKWIFGLGGGVAILSFFMLVLQHQIKLKREQFSEYVMLSWYSNQMRKDELDIRMKLMAYNEMAKKYNEKNTESKMPILKDSDLADIKIFWKTSDLLTKKYRE